MLMKNNIKNTTVVLMKNNINKCYSDVNEK